MNHLACIISEPDPHFITLRLHRYTPSRDGIEKGQLGEPLGEYTYSNMSPFFTNIENAMDTALVPRPRKISAMFWPSGEPAIPVLVAKR